MSKKWGSVHSAPLGGVFTAYSYVSGMYRVCVGYVSGKRRKIQGAERVPGTRKEGKISPTNGTDEHGNAE